MVAGGCASDPFCKGDDAMAITLPLTLFGIGLLIYYLFGVATHALPIAIGLTAGFAAAAFGFSTPVAVLIGAASAFVPIPGGRFAGLATRGPLARGLLIALFAFLAPVAGGLPAVIARRSVREHG